MRRVGKMHNLMGKKNFSDENLDVLKNPLLCFLKSSVALRSGHTDEAINLCPQTITNGREATYYYTCTVGLI